MHTSLSVVGSIVLGLSLFACESKIVTDGDGGSGNGGGQGGSGNAGGQGGAGGACAGFRDAPDGAPLTVRFTNQSGLPIYLPGTCDSVSLDMQPSAGDDGLTYWYDESCLQTCESLQTESRFACDACAPSVYLLPPGGTLEFPWNGTAISYSERMPESCWAFPEGPDATCPLIVPAENDRYSINALGFGSCEDCECNGAEDQCYGTPSGLSAYHDPAVFQYPGSNVVEVVFNICAFGCAGG